MARSAGLVPVSRHDSQPGRVADSNAASGRAGSEPWLRVTDTVTDRDLDLNLKLNLALTRSLRRAAFLTLMAHHCQEGSPALPSEGLNPAAT